MPRTGSLRVVPLDGNEAGDRSIDREGLQPVPRQFIKNNGPVEKLLRSEITADICLPAPSAGQFRGEDEYPPVISRLLEKERSKDGGNHFQKFSFPFFEFIENSFVSRERRRERELLLLLLVSTLPSSRYRRVIC